LPAYALGSASASTPLNRAHPVILRLHLSASAGLICRHSSRTFSRRNAAAVSSGDIEAITRSMASMARVYGEIEGGREGGLPRRNGAVVAVQNPPDVSQP
jgi:hypothetical protein